MSDTYTYERSSTDNFDMERWDKLPTKTQENILEEVAERLEMYVKISEGASIGQCCNLCALTENDCTICPVRPEKTFSEKPPYPCVSRARLDAVQKLSKKAAKQRYKEILDALDYNGFEYK
jgi:hypothetical protein